MIAFPVSELVPHCWTVWSITVLFFTWLWWPDDPAPIVADPAGVAERACVAKYRRETQGEARFGPPTTVKIGTVGNRYRVRIRGTIGNTGADFSALRTWRDGVMILEFTG